MLAREVTDLGGPSPATVDHDVASKFFVNAFRDYDLRGVGDRQASGFACGKTWYGRGFSLLRASKSGLVTLPTAAAKLWNAK